MLRDCTRLLLCATTLLGTWVVAACSLADNREATVRDHLTQRVNGESKGALTLDIFKKTNGYERQGQGLQLYVLEWQGTLSARQEFWKGGNFVEGYWQDFGALPGRPSGGFMVGNSWKRFRKGALLDLRGDATLLKTENGWRVQELAVKAAQVTDPGPKSPFDGVWSVSKSGTHLTVVEEDSGTFKFAEAVQPVQDDKEFDARLIPVDDRLQGTFTSYNFRATHGVEFSYTVTLKLTNDGKLAYSVTSKDLTSLSENNEATRVK